jgi:hypothetical protein
MCGQVVAFPWKDNSQLMDCRDIATRTCNKKLAGRVMQSCGLFTNGQQVRRACTSAVNDLLGSAAVTEDYEVEPYEEEKFDYSYLSEDNTVQSLRGSTSASDEDSADEELYDYGSDWWNRDWSRRADGTPWSVQPNGQPWSVRSNGTPWSVQPNGQPWWNGNGGGNNARNTKKGTMTRDGLIVFLFCFPTTSLNTHSPVFLFTTDINIHIEGDAEVEGMVNGECRSGCKPLPPYSCICPKDSGNRSGGRGRGRRGRGRRAPYYEEEE